MDSIEVTSERLAHEFLLKEAADAALGATGHVKLAAASWLAPLVGTGLGALGGTAAGYLSSPEVEDAKKTRKRMLIGALTGAGVGGAAGLGVSAMGDGKAGPADLESLIREEKYKASQIPSELPAAERAGIALDNVKAPYGLSGLAMAGGVGDPSQAGIKGGLGRASYKLVDWLRNNVPAIGARSERVAVREAGRRLAGGQLPIKSELARVMEGKEVGKPVDPKTLSGLEQSISDEMSLKANRPQFHKSLADARVASEMSGMQQNSRAAKALLNVPGMKAVVAKLLHGRASDAVIREGILGRSNVSPTLLATAAGRLQGSDAINTGKTPLRAAQATRALSQGPLAASLLGPALGAATYNLPLPGMKLIGSR